jgi:hypothetical protein
VLQWLHYFNLTCIKETNHIGVFIFPNKDTQKAIKISSIQAIYDENYFSYKYKLYVSSWTVLFDKNLVSIDLSSKKLPQENCALFPYPSACGLSFLVKSILLVTMKYFDQSEWLSQTSLLPWAPGIEFHGFYKRVAALKFDRIITKN